MNESLFILAERYAKAVIDLAIEAGAVEAVGDQLATLAEAALADARTQAFWRSLKIPDEEKRHALQDLLEKMEAHALTRNAANLLTDRGRFELLPELVRVYRRMAHERSQQVDIEVTAAAELSDEMQSRIREGLARMTGKTVSMTVRVDPELIGGVKVRIGNTVIDGSARGRLRSWARRSFAAT